MDFIVCIINFQMGSMNEAKQIKEMEFTEVLNIMELWLKMRLNKAGYVYFRSNHENSCLRS